jgi:uncharacterized membrane protein YjjP (DUF1212 family)
MYRRQLLKNRRFVAQLRMIIKITFTYTEESRLSKNRKKQPKFKKTQSSAQKYGGTYAVGVSILFMGLAFYSAVAGDWIRAGLSFFASALGTLGYIMHNRIAEPGLKKTLSYVYYLGFIILVAAVIILGTWR